MMLPVLLMLIAPQTETPAAAPASVAAPDPAAPRPDGDMGAWFSGDVFPTQAVQEPASGTVYYMVDVDADGAPVKCTVTKSSGSPSLDKRSCEILMQKGRFIPGRDAAGRAIAGQYSQRVKWDSRETPGVWVMMTVSGPDNGVCSVDLDGKTRYLDPTACRGLAGALVEGGQALDKPISIRLSDVAEAILPEGQ